MSLPTFTTPSELAALTGWSERSIRRLAREHGCCRIVGNKMILAAEDVEELLRLAKPEPMKSRTQIAAPGSGGYEALVNMRGRPEPGITGQEAVRIRLEQLKRSTSKPRSPK